MATEGANRAASRLKFCVRLLPLVVESLTCTLPSILDGFHGSNPVWENAILILEGIKTFSSALVTHATRSNALSFHHLLLATPWLRPSVHSSSRSSRLNG